MYMIAICDDDAKVCSYLEALIYDYGKSQNLNLAIEVFERGEELCHFLYGGNWIDLLFLDIEFPKMDGIEIGIYIREQLKNEAIQIVYISSKEDYYAQLFDVRPMHFLLKPLKKKKVVKDIEKAFELTSISGKTFTYKIGHETRRIQIKDIIYFESMERKIRMVTAIGDIIFNGNLAEVFLALEKYRFFYIHRSYIVNYIHILIFKDCELIMSNKDALPVSRQRSTEIKKIQLKYEMEKI